MEKLKKEIVLLEKPLKPLKDVIYQWLINIENYGNDVTCKDNLHDVPYWYEERPNVGVLASAVWQTGGYSLVSYSRHQKQKEENEKYPNLYPIDPFRFHGINRTSLCLGSLIPSFFLAEVSILSGEPRVARSSLSLLFASIRFSCSCRVWEIV